MLLTIDIGNTNIVTGFFSDKKLINLYRFNTIPNSTAHDWWANLYANMLSDGLRKEDIKGVSVSSVVPRCCQGLDKIFPGIPFFSASASAPFSYKNIIPRPAEVGTDRLVNAEAAVRIYGAPVIIIDSGTATTVCAVNKNKEWIGSSIMPGLELSLQALASKASRLFSVGIEVPTKNIGTTTATSIQSGIVLGHAYMIDGMVRAFKEEMGYSPSDSFPVVATGGALGKIFDILQEANEFDEALTLKGLTFLFNETYPK